MDAVELLTCIKEDKIDGNSENEAEQTEICFICNEILTDQNPEVHINFCLDKKTEPPQSAAPSEPAAKEENSLTSLSKMMIMKMKSLTQSDKFVFKKRSLENASFEKAEKKATKPCPFYKKMPHTSFCVDAFCYGPIEGITCYFLSHFHSDHYMGLTRKFNYGKIYCSDVTANLIEHIIKVDRSFIVRLPMNERVAVQDVFVTLIDANHCPGAVLFLFELPNGMKYLHTGDFRASLDHINNPLIKDVKFDKVYLDNTYGTNSIYSFPLQQEVCTKTIEAIKRKIEGDGMKRLAPLNFLILFGSYLIGKEKIILAVSKEFNWKIYADERKRNIIKCLCWPELEEKLTANPHETPLHLVSMGHIIEERLSQYLLQYSKYTHIMGFKPTGWSMSSEKGYEPTVKDCKVSKERSRKDAILIYSVPYSEHSSYAELQMFLNGVRAKQVINTVNFGK